MNLSDHYRLLASALAINTQTDKIISIIWDAGTDGV